MVNNNYINRKYKLNQISFGSFFAHKMFFQNNFFFIATQIDVGSDNDDNSSDETLSIDKTRPASLDKMIALVATLVERSRGPDLRLQLSPRDYNAIAGGKVN